MALNSQGTAFGLFAVNAMLVCYALEIAQCRASSLDHATHLPAKPDGRDAKQSAWAGGIIALAPPLFPLQGA
jgi:hypothetical protein